MSTEQFPEDVTQATIDACAAAYGKDWSVGRIVARAIMAERERCAEIVESFAPGGDRYEHGHDDATMRVAIRSAILGARQCP